MSLEPEDAVSALLFVDDDPVARRTFARAMSARGFAVDLAADGAGALELVTRRRYALIAADLNMPDINGVRLIERLHGVQPDATFILVTGVRELHLPRSAAAEHIASVVRKPWDADELAACIWTHVQMRREREPGALEPTTDAGGGALGSVLVVESDPLDADFMLRALVAGGLPDYRLLHSEQLDDAVAITQERKLQLIVAELTLPDARGLDAIRALREAAPNTPLVVVGRDADDVLALAALRAGAQDYLVRRELGADSMRRALRFAIARQRAEEAPPRSRSIAVSDGNAWPERVASALARARRENSRTAILYASLQRPGSTLLDAPLGDTLLGRVTERIRATLREYDSLAYLGGDRFGVILPALPAGDRASIPARRLLAGLSAPFDVGGRSVSLTARVGIGIYPDDADTAEELCRCADMAVYRAQALDDGGCEFFDEVCQATVRAREELDRELDRALADWSFVLQYRPEHALDDGRLVAAEAVVCWRRDDGILWEPSRFMPALEQRELSTRLTPWLLEQACQQGQAWQARHPGLAVSIDLSAKQLLDPSLRGHVQRALEHSGLSPALLELEIPEDATLLEPIPRTLAQLAELGVRLTVDDFGHRLPLARLSELPISALKIGPTLADLAGTDARGAALIRAAADVSRDLRLSLAASGVDEPGQLDFLQRIGCERAQGELYGPARPARASWLSA
jgi:diguanylate cyclase (GGDEF)-like protein